MKPKLYLCLMAGALFALPAFGAGVTVTSPANNSTVTSPVHYVASATTTCDKGVASMGIYTAAHELAYVVDGATLDYELTLGPGTYDTVVEEWDSCGGAATKDITITVSGSGTSGVTVTKPINGSTVTSPVNFVATATSTCKAGVASMGIYTAPKQLAYVVNGASLNTNLTLAAGTYNTVVEEWDYCGGAATKDITITVTGSGTSGVTVTKPTDGATVTSPVNFVATATSTCKSGVASMGIYTAPNQLAYVVNGASLNTNLTLAAGTYNTVVEEWDYCGGAATKDVTITVSGGGTSGVTVTKPTNGSTVTSPVNFVATATSTCKSGVASMGIYTAPNQLAYVVNGASLNTSLTLAAGTYNTVVEEWDYCGGAATTPITITVSGSGGGGSTFSGLQKQSGWTGYALLPPGYGICSSCKSNGTNVNWSWTPNIASPSISGASTKTTIGGTEDFSDVLWNNHLIGDFSSQGLPDKDKTLVPSLHNFVYDVYFYGDNLEKSQALEFDLNQFFDNNGYIWGHECRIAGGHEWDTWDNVNKKWIDTGVACNPVSGSWNHLTITVERTSDDKVLFQSITLNGKTSNINITRPHGSAPGWYGVTVNYQIDGNANQDDYTVYIDELNFTYY